MSTDNIRAQAEEARAALGRVASAAETRRRTVRRERNGLQTERDRVVIGARAAMRSIDDVDDVLEEEEGQLDEILDGPPAPTLEQTDQETPADQAVTEPDVPVTPPEQSDPAPAPPAPEPAPVQSPAEPSRAERTADVRHWGVFQWILAILAAFVAYGLCRKILDGLDIDDVLLRIPFFIGSVFIGFGLGGFFGTFLDDFWNRVRGTRDT